MVRLVVLDDNGDPDAGPPPPPLLRQHQALRPQEISPPLDDRSNPNLENGFPKALSCYPIVSVLASYLDLNTLSELSSTCRQVHANLMEYRSLLVQHALRCVNENTKPAERLGNALHASHAVWTAYGQNGVKIGRITSGKVGACARDMVSDCRRCGKIICRNCVVKAPPTTLLKLRHRRLCRTCMKSPLDGLTTVVRAVGDDGMFSRRVVCPGLRTCGIVLTFCRGGNTEDGGANAALFPDDEEVRTYARERCTCADHQVWICQPCGQTMRTDDTTYVRGWKWRTRYSHCGGMGAGLGEGNEGVECGRTRDCLAARMVEKDVECCAEELAALQMEMSKAEGQGRHWNGSSYSTQEIVGIGGKVKTKVKKRVPVGAIVKEYEDERETEQFLGREQSGANRSWCSWCARVVAGKKDMDGAARSTDSIASCSSGISA